MTGRLREALWLVPRACTITLAVGTSLLAASRAWNRLQTPVADWQLVSAEFREALVVVGPLIVLCALWAGGRFTARHGLLAPSTSGRSRALVARQLGALIAVATSAYVVGLAPMLIDAAARAAAGRVSIAVIASGILALVALVCVGYLVGVVAPTPAVALFVAVVVVGPWLFLGGVTGSDVWVLTPVWTWGAASAGTVEHPLMTLERIAFMGAVALAASVAARSWIEDRDRVRGPRRSSSLRALALPALLVPLVLLRPPPSLLVEADPPVTCREILERAVCVHGVNAPLLDELSEVVATVLSAAGPDLAAPIVEIRDQALASTSLLAGAAGPPVLDGRHWVHMPTGAVSLDAWSDSLARDLADRLGGTWACATEDRNLAQDDPYYVSQAAAEWIYRQARGDAAAITYEPVHEFDPMPVVLAADPTDVRRWLREQAAPLARCEAATFPGS